MHLFLPETDCSVCYYTKVTVFKLIKHKKEIGVTPSLQDMLMAALKAKSYP